MPELVASKLVLTIVMAAFTALAAVIDLRTRKIPNKLTMPVFLLGLVYQGVFFGLTGLADAGLGFLLGFGTLFVLWLIGGGGGGDAKLMGAVSVWMGFRATLFVLVLSTLFVVVGTVAAIAWSGVSTGIYRTKDKFASARRDLTVEQKTQRRIMTYALPVALATWLVLLWIHVRPGG